MDPDIKQLQEEVKHLTAVTQDTNRIVHGMRRSQRWHSFISILWWAVILGLTAASYWYALPYIQKAQDIYSGYQTQAHNAQSLQQQVQDTINKYLGGSSTTSQ